MFGCTDNIPVAPHPSAVRFELGEETDDAEPLVLWPSDDVWSGESQDAPTSATLAPMAMQATLAGATVPTIRIGVVQSSSAILLGSTADYTIRDRANGVVLMTGTNGTATVTLASVPESYIYYQVTCSNNVAALSALKAKAESFGHLTFTESITTPIVCTRLFVGRIPATSTNAQKDAFKLLLVQEGIATSTTLTARTVSVGNQTVYRITRGATSTQNVNPVIVTSASGEVLIGPSGATPSRYRGQGEARLVGGTSLAGVNELPVEQYLYGVVPKELGPIQYPELEAQKAQAIAARTYALAGLGKRGADGYDLRATTDDQAYGGVSAEHPVSTSAVDATFGVVATYDGKLISALFSSTSGGHTADNEESFIGQASPYLRGVPDAERGEAFDHVPSLAVFMAHASPNSLRAAREGDFESDWAFYHRWTFDWSAEEISSVVSAFAGRSVGAVRAINVLQRGPSGRVLAIEYVTDAGTFTDTKDHIRSSLRYINASGAPTNLPSTLFFVEPLGQDKGEEPGGFRVYGGGFGHGVGLSQTGAVGMAQKGHSADEILHHYYSGISLVNWY